MELLDRETLEAARKEAQRRRAQGDERGVRQMEKEAMAELEFAESTGTAAVCRAQSCDICFRPVTQTNHSCLEAA